jgi:Protein of unknown function (DUF1822)
MILSNTPLQSETIWLAIDESDSLQPSTPYSNTTAQHNAQLNQLCLQKTQTWLTEIGIANSPAFAPEQMASIWEVVNGSALNIGNRRLILIPTDQLDREELRVPQEWVDIPAWIGDYYLAIQIDLESHSMNIWGYASHRTLRETGSYSQLDRTYSIASDFMVADLDILWMAQILDLQEITTVPPISSLALDRSQSAIDQLSHPSPYSPRLDLDFGTWAAILSNNNLREHLYQRRLQVANLQNNPNPTLNLGHWIQGELDQAIAQGWEMVNKVMGREFAPIRSRGDMSIERAKLINLQYQLQETTVVMLVGLTPRDATAVEILVEVSAAPGQMTLPPQLKLSYIDDQGEELQVVISRSQDLQIQLPRFTCDVGTAFNLQLQLDGISQIEKFIA